MNKKTALVLGAVAAALIGVIILTLYLLQSQQEVRSRASQEQAPAEIQQTSCPTPSQVDGVKVEYPNCIGNICNFTQASCSWNSVAGATNYQLKISQVESEEVVRNDQVEAAVTRVEFPIVQGKTYKCEVSALNSCGNVSAVSADQLLCQADALIPTTAPTTAPTRAPSAAPTTAAPTTVPPTTAPTTVPTVVITSTPVPTIVPTGSFLPTMGILGGILLLIIVGAVFVAI